ncbi:bi-domain-containing oxidoreductase [Spirosoma montaniterrae]|uniref:Dehydrogenase n=1 Tax=Spirosoma montaniterrae TaxID=1178516 RepID=A0A1P9WYW4_9BACT|nr:bi-domain-containing oxidoreductase [Spirosoma montaniterrae]AQG80576.1 dehydrogenase [Spirosoma montaniterrae]
MNQLIQDLRTGETRLIEVPIPAVGPGQVLIRTRRSLVSPGTERMLVSFGRGNWLDKAWQQPERVKQVLNKVRTDGLRPTLETVFRKLDQPLPLGYCNVGIVLAVGEGVTDLHSGQRVVSNGPHAEAVCVARNLVAAIPDAVSDDDAAFTVMGAIGLQGIRLLNPTLGETVVVIGLGLIGLLTAQLLRLNGCRVIGTDVNEHRLTLARQFGITAINATDAVSTVLARTDNVGADGIVITASTRHDKLIAQAAQMSRKRGRIVLVGVVGLSLNRSDFYAKELTFQVSCSYGPGRYDPTYEQQGQDYPLPFVRWTENRNFQAILHLLGTKQLLVGPLISEVVRLEAYQRVYDRMNDPKASGGPMVASLFRYTESAPLESTLTLNERYVSAGSSAIGLIGAGNFAASTLLPALKAAGASVKTIASANGLSATRLAQKFAIARSTTDYQTILNDPAISLCIIATRHNSHARLTIDALQAGKHVFVEKPLAIYAPELAEIVSAQQVSERFVTVGFNRRFSPYVQKMKALVGGAASHMTLMNVVATMNAGAVPPDSWLHNRTVGGGRIPGEACHLVDLITFLTGSRVAGVCLNTMGPFSETADSASLLLRYENGATGVVNYFANGSTSYAKERVEVYTQGRTLILDNFRQLTGYGFQNFSRMTGRQDKGHAEQFRRLVAWLSNPNIRPNELLIPFADCVNATQTMLAALQSGRDKRWVPVDTNSLTTRHLR